MSTMEEMTPVRGGTEWEVFGLIGEPRARPVPLTSTVLEPVMAQLHPDIKAVGHIRNRFLQNGARLYIDVGNHPEYCTPPSEDFEEAVAHTYAGEAEFMDMVRRAQIADKIGGYAIYRRVLAKDADKPGHYTGLGYHTSLGIRRRRDGVRNTPEARLSHTLHLSTASLYLGAGAIVQNSVGDWVYIRHQKEPCLNCEYHWDTMTSRPIANTRDESHAGDDQIRIHITSGDANHSPWQQRMTFGISAIILRTIDAGISSPVTVPDGQFMKLLRLASRDMPLSQVATLEKDGQPYRMSPYDVQEMLYKEHDDFLRNHMVTEAEVWAHQQHGQVLSDLKLHDSAILSNRIDWAARLENMGGQAVLDDDSTHWGSPKLLRLDMAYDLVGTRKWSPDDADDPNTPLDADEVKGFGVRRRSAEFSEWMPSNEVIQRARFEPPTGGKTTGQALARAAFIREFGRTPAEYAKSGRPDAIADWEAGKVNNRTHTWPLSPEGPTRHLFDHNWEDTREFV